MATIPERQEEATKKLEQGTAIVREFANGVEGQYVQTLSGPIPTLKEWLAQNENTPEGVAKLRADLSSNTGDTLVGGQKTSIPNTVYLTQNQRNTLTFFDFGGDPSGVNDSSMAFNNYIAYIFSLRDVSKAITGPFKIDIPRGVYRAGNINLTNIVLRQTIIDFNGSVIIASAPGKPVFDCTDSRWLRFRDGTIFSPEVGMAKTAIMFSKSTDSVTVGNNYLDNMMLVGHYTVAAHMNLGSETSGYHACTIQNANQDPAAYAAVFDGMCLPRFFPESDYRTINRTPNNGVSFTNNVASGATQFRNIGGGTAIFLAKSEGFIFDSGGYALTLNDAAFELYSTSIWRNKGLVANVQFENSQNNNPFPGAVGIRYGFKFTSDGISTATAIEGLKCDTFGAQCEDSMFYNATGGTVRLSNFYLRMASMHGDGVQNMFNKGSGQFLVDGEIHTQQASKLNLGELTSFTGLISVDSIPSLMSPPPAGAYTIFDRTNGNQQQVGVVSITNNAGTASPISFRNSAANGIDIYGANTVPSVRAGGTSTDIDLSLQPKGAGLLRYGVRTTRADTPVTASFPMKMADGTTVYVALVAAP